MRCRICHADLTVRGYSQRGDRRAALYNPCPRLQDPFFHPAYAERQGPWGKSGLQFRHSRSFKTDEERLAHAKTMADRFLKKCADEIEAGRLKGAQKMVKQALYWSSVVNGLEKSSAAEAVDNQ
jgi:hypothetical protein